MDMAVTAKSKQCKLINVPNEGIFKCYSSLICIKPAYSHTQNGRKVISLKDGHSFELSNNTPVEYYPDARIIIV